MLTGCGSYPEDSSAVTVQSNSSVASVLSTQSKSADTQPQNEKKADSMQIVIEDKQFPVSLESSDTVTALTEMLPLTLDMSDGNTCQIILSFQS